MPRLLFVLLVALLSVVSGKAEAQVPPFQIMCGVPPAPCTGLNPLPVTGAGGGGTFNTGAIAQAAPAPISPGLQPLAQNLLNELFIDHPTLDVTGPGGSSGALRVIPATGSLVGVSVNPPADILAGPTAISSGGTPSLSVNTNGTSATNLVLSGSAGLTAIFQCSINGSFQSAQAFNHTTGFTESGATGNGVWTFPSAGCAQIVITASAGSTTATMEASAGPPVPPVTNTVYLSSPTTLTNGQVAPLTSTNNMRLRAALDTTASATFPSLTAGVQPLYENLLGQLYIDHPTLDVTGPGGSADALRVVCANGCGANVTVNPPMDVLAGPTAISSGGTPSLSVNTNGTSATNLVLSGSSGLTAIFQCFINGSAQSAQAFNHTTGFTESGASADGVWTFPSAGCAQIVITASAGSTTATMEASAGPPVPPVTNAVYLSTPATLTNGQVAPFTATNDMRLRVSLATASTTNRSIALTTGGTSQTLMAANPNRRGLIIDNPCDATGQGIGTPENIAFNFTTAASLSAVGSMHLLPCGSYNPPGPVTPEAITVIAATTGHQITAKEF